jgi:hypothetical protein
MASPPTICEATTVAAWKSVTQSARAGYEITVRLIRDWAQAGLLDRPRKRPAGRGRGSNQALYPANQRELLLTLLSKRAGNGISSLARIPVGIWMYWGDEYVPLRQARRAMLCLDRRSQG